MALAAGVPVPEVFVLEREPGINALAAGYASADTALAVPLGALDRLNRDQIQGVLTHEIFPALSRRPLADLKRLDQTVATPTAADGRLEVFECAAAGPVAGADGRRPGPAPFTRAAGTPRPLGTRRGT